MMRRYCTTLPVNTLPVNTLPVNTVTAIQLIAKSSRAVSEEPAAIPAVLQPSGDSRLAGKIAILNDTLPGFDRECASRLVEELRKAGCDVTELSAVQVCDPSILSPERFFLYVIPQCRTYPAAGMEALITFASGRGHVFFLGGPFLDDPVWPTETGWVNRGAIAAAKTGVVPQRGDPGAGRSALDGRRRTHRVWREAFICSASPGGVVSRTAPQE